MQTGRKKGKCWRLYVGLTASVTGLVTTSLAEFLKMQLWPSMAFCFGGLVLCIMGGSLLWREAAIESASHAESAHEFPGGYLGEIYLNGYYLAAYECETSGGRKQFRLICSPPIKPAQEAAFIRYMVHEGFIGDLWPQMSGRIEEEAGWAFFAEP
jgi:hypothetical protein